MQRYINKVWQISALGQQGFMCAGKTSDRTRWETEQIIITSIYALIRERPVLA